MEKKNSTKSLCPWYDPPFHPDDTYPWQLIPRTLYETHRRFRFDVKPASIIVRAETASTTVRAETASTMEPHIFDLNAITRTKWFEAYAKSALNHFNSNEGTNYTLFRLVNRCVARYGLRLCVHLNFTAKGDGDGDGDGEEDGSPLFFYADVTRIDEKDEESDGSENSEDETEYKREVKFDIQVEGCSMIEQVDTRNPLAMRCRKCDDLSVIHPGPSSGYRVVAGDKFLSSDFMHYNPYKELLVREPDSPLVRSRARHLERRLSMFRSCARRALQHFNDNEKSWFHLVEVKNGFSVAMPFERVVHLNFLAKLLEKPEKPTLFFAVAAVPLLTAQGLDDWDTYMEKYISVQGCCQLTKRGRGSYFGRVCGMCISGVIHPDPRDGYEVAAGDSFDDAQFMQVGRGIF